jgi:hypothetical protein
VAPEPPSPTRYTHLDDEQAALEGTDVVRRSDYGGGGSPYSNARYRTRSRIPPGLGMPERPAVATLLHLMSAEEAYNSKHGRYGSLAELVQAKNALLDVPVSGGSFSRRNYKFQIVVEEDGFRALAIPGAPGLRPFVGDDTGFVRVGLQ